VATHGLTTWPVFLVMGGGMGAIYTLGLGILGDRFAARDLTAANVLFVMTYHAGLLVGPASVGAAMEVASPQAFPFALTLPLIVLAFASLAAHRRPQPGSPTPA
jgi:hypothetical protein